MENSGYIALSRMTVQQRALEIRAANIANLNTPGYKGEKVMFSSFMVPQTGTSNVPGEKPVQMVQEQATWRDFSQGEISRTGNPLDLALRGDGFFVINTSQGERYTRSGRFSLSAAGQVVDVGGNPVLGTDGRPVTVPPDAGALIISGDGSLSSGINQIAKFRVVKFDDPQSLKSEGNSLFATTQPAQPVARPQIAQGAIENANIQAITELTKMMSEMREFDFASQFTDGSSEMQQTAIDRIGHKA